MADKNDDGSCCASSPRKCGPSARYVKAALADPAQREAIGRTLGIAMSPLGATPSARAVRRR